MTEPFERIVLFPGAELADFLFAVAAALKSRYGSRIHVVCSTQQHFSSYSQANGTRFDSISLLSMLAGPQSPRPLFAESVQTAHSHERFLGTTYNLIAIANRHFGRGYALGGSGHPRSRYSETSTYESMLEAYNQYFNRWNALVEEFSPTLVIGGSKPDACVARAHGIPFRFMLGSRYENLHYWSINEYFETHELADEFNHLPDTLINSEIVRPYLVERVHQRQFSRNARTAGMMRLLARKALQRVYWRLRGYEKARGYYTLEELRFIYRRWSHARKMTDPTGPFSVKRLSDLVGQPFLFYPLHTEPEASVGQASPEYFSQLSAIASLSRDLPAGVLLAVKETIHGVGRRPRDFYTQIADMKNVIFLDMMEYGLEIVREATATATITGTAGMEAAVLGKPVISFGRHNNYNVIPHVFTVEKEEDICIYLDRIFDGVVDSAQARIDGARYLQAVKNRSFDMRGYDYGKRPIFSQTEVEEAVKALERSLNQDQSHQRIRAESAVAAK